MKQLKPAWLLIIGLALTTLLFLIDPLLYKLHIRGFWHYLVLGFIVAVPVALITKPKW